MLAVAFTSRKLIARDIIIFIIKVSYDVKIKELEVIFISVPIKLSITLNNPLKGFKYNIFEKISVYDPYFK